MIFRKSAKKNSPAPILESVEHITGKDEFINKAGLFREDLGAASSFQEMLNLWRTTQIPYKIDLPDPYSDEYREEVTSIYAGLTGEDYDVANEWTSTKQSAEDFERGYPWVSGDFGVIADEIAKPIQVLRALQHRRGQEIRAIEFGSGWGNLSVPMAKAGINVTLVDIDQGFLDRASRIAAREGITMATVCGDFLGVAQSMSERFDVVIFQSAFHHCLEFQQLLRTIKANVLLPGGEVLFVNEPITAELHFPWGLRYDGESLWAIMCNKWLELGFHCDFFAEMLLRNGFLPQNIPAIPTLLGEGWRAAPGETPIPFSQLRLPTIHSSSFHASDGVWPGRFTRAESTLPALGGGLVVGYELQFANYSAAALRFSVLSSAEQQNVELASGERITLRCRADSAPLSISAQTFVPDQQTGSGDQRVLGVSLDHLALF